MSHENPGVGGAGEAALDGPRLLSGVDRGILHLSRGVRWVFGPYQPWIDLLFGLLAGGWAVLMVVNPLLFDGGLYAAMTWLPDWLWIGGFSIIAVLHGIGLRRGADPHLRLFACVASAGIWLFLAGTFTRNGATPGVLVYGLLGLLALLAGLHAAWHRGRAA